MLKTPIGVVSHRRRPTMLLFLGLLCLAVTCSANFGYPPPAPVPVTIYYETLCPFSIDFILNKLLPAYRDFNYLMKNVTLVPYGHVNRLKNVSFPYECQHGNDECAGNKLHGCAVKYIKDSGILLNYLGCLMYQCQGKQQGYPVSECANMVPNDTYQLLLQCYNTDEGWQVFNSNGETTDNFFGSDDFFVPYVSFRNVKNEDFSAMGTQDFKMALCYVNGVVNFSCSDEAGNNIH